jgi:hypothetical protein
MKVRREGSDIHKVSVVSHRVYLEEDVFRIDINNNIIYSSHETRVKVN